MKTIVIAAMGLNREIGMDNKLLWKIPEDMKHFKNTTTGHVVLMGRKTHESFGGRILPNRMNIVVTSNAKNRKSEEKLRFVETVAEGMHLARQLATEGQDLYVIGGGQIYSYFKKIADELVLTIVHDSFDHADTFFPEYDLLEDYKLVSSRDSLFNQPLVTYQYYEKTDRTFY